MLQPSSVIGSHLCSAAPELPETADVARTAIATAIILVSRSRLFREFPRRRNASGCLDPATRKVKIMCSEPTGRGTMVKSTTDCGDAASPEVSRRAFLSTGAAGVVLAGAGAAEAQHVVPRNWDRSADVVVIGAGVAGLPA